MKKVFCIFITIILILSLQGCTVILGGTHQRELGTITTILSDGENQYLKYSIDLEHGYVKNDATTFALCNPEFNDTALYEIDNETEVLVSGCYMETYKDDLDDNLDIQEGYEYLLEQIQESFADCKNLEIVILKKGHKIFGTILCYNRTSGRSGLLLSYEDLDKSYLFEVENQKIHITNELPKTAVLALNESHYVAYSDKTFYSARKEADENAEKYKVEICKDIWWDIGPTFYSNVTVYFADDVFMICGNRSTKDSDNATLIVGTINGQYVETLIDDKIVFVADGE